MAQERELKQSVAEYWNEQPCGTQFSDKEKFSKEYFDMLGPFNAVYRKAASFLAWLLGGDRVGWFLNMEFEKKSSHSAHQS